MSYSDEVIADQPTAYWKMNEPSGDIIDSMGSVVATPVGVLKYGVKNYANQGINIDTQGEFRVQSIPASFAWLIDTSLTIEFCLRRNSLDTETKAILSYRNSTTDGRQYSLFFLGGSSILFDIGGTGSRWTTGYSIQDTDWHHVIVRHRGSDARRELWIDGRRVSGATQLPTTAEAAGTDFKIGASNSSIASRFNGCLSDVAIYNGTYLSNERCTAHWLAIQNRNAGLVMSAL
ncbi:hypothetical protein A2707_03735 [Candidatus Saccharibacteria bacterium RIFCSPHIGHO2_01_FULL_45_15]|nr:MAG: hypothetical protein A2707_03735 [Candidatus Saccharibacteria bacterium RIFCSPHIGHO2_01_FULL_45_15]OGL28691.1 MAG: hypothetical protein A3C39_05555 [Candidatus Saccharibacteria bacterium RIFCSPHIGHO2_02_FULL_46_12]OGL31494.1 MAG: hypothetical protein A3E76_03740 [Candidatus Saccharibacteria bacterium RIFCSPHIGHO2_12_FULL_44_22]